MEPTTNPVTETVLTHAPLDRSDQGLEAYWILAGGRLPCLDLAALVLAAAEDTYGPRFAGARLIRTSPSYEYDDNNYYTREALFLVAPNVTSEEHLRQILVSVARQRLAEDASLAAELAEDWGAVSVDTLLSEVPGVDGLLWKHGVVMVPSWVESRQTELGLDDVLVEFDDAEPGEDAATGSEGVSS